MGQQQLLLVILVTIIVGIATVVAINTFGSAANNANVDAVRNDLAQIAASAQGYYMKPEMMSGGGGDFTGLTYENFAFASKKQITDGSTTKIKNSNGEYDLGTPSGDSFTITATPNQAKGNIIAYVEADCINISEYDADGGASAPTACN